MKILFIAYFYQKNFKKKLPENLLGSESGTGSESQRFRKSDPDPVKNRPDPQHWVLEFPTHVNPIISMSLTNPYRFVATTNTFLLSKANFVSNPPSSTHIFLNKNSFINPFPAPGN
jgi:hypothetical protein